MSTLKLIASGSQGNCALYQANGTNILIDAGISASRIASGLAARGLAPTDLTGIIVTHEHADHASGLEVWYRKWRTPIFANLATSRAIKSAARVPSEFTNAFVTFETAKYFEINGVTIDPIPTRHDAVDPVGFMLYHNGCYTGYMTDTGAVGSYALERLADVDTMALESNYDIGLLVDDRTRPDSVKSRVINRNGHLSNDDCASTLAKLPRLRLALLCHLSRSCNDPQIAVEASRKALEGRGVTVEAMRP